MNEKRSLLLKYGQRELQTLQEMQPFKECGVLPDNNNEIFRRGLHCMKQLLGLDEKNYLDDMIFWMEALRSANTIDTYEMAITKSREIASLVYSIMMAKYGAQKADLFHSVVVLINSLYEEIMKFLQDKDTKIASANKALFIPVPLPPDIHKRSFQIHSVIATFFNR